MAFKVSPTVMVEFTAVSLDTIVSISLWWQFDALFTGCPSCLMYKQGKPACLSTYNIGLLLHLKS